MRRLIVSMIAALVAVSLVPIASAQEEDDQVTLRVGLTQDWEVLNPTSGYTVPAYEVWNLHYATSPIRPRTISPPPLAWPNRGRRSSPASSTCTR